MQDGKGGALTDWKYETPPPHIEWKATRSGYHGESDDKPDNSEAPKDEADHNTNNIEHISCMLHLQKCLVFS